LICVSELKEDTPRQLCRGTANLLSLSVIDACRCSTGKYMDNLTSNVTTPFTNGTAVSSNN